MRRSKKDIVLLWRKQHPHGRRAELYRSGIGVSKATVDRWWNASPVTERPYSAEEKVRMWRDEHPDGTKLQCQKDTGLSRRSVYLRWDARPESAPTVAEEPAKVDEFGQMYLF